MEAIFTAIQSIGIWMVIVGVILYLVITKSKAHDERKKAKGTVQNTIDIQTIIAEHDEHIIETIMSRLSNGVPHTVEDEERNVKRNAYIDETLKTLMHTTGAHRAFVFKYHNGERGIDGIGFQKTSCTNERVVSWVTPIIKNCQNLQRAMLSSIYKTLNAQDIYEVADIEMLKETDVVTYDFVKDHGAKSMFVHALKREDGLVTGFVGIEYVDQTETEATIITQALEESSLKIVGAMLGSFEKGGLVNK